MQLSKNYFLKDVDFYQIIVVALQAINFANMGHFFLRLCQMVVGLFNDPKKEKKIE